MYYINITLEPDVNQKDATEVLNVIKSMPEVSSATMEDDGDDDEC
jgi:cell division protein FtsX